MFEEQQTSSPDFASCPAPNPNYVPTFNELATEPSNHPPGSGPYASPYPNPPDYGLHNPPASDLGTNAASQIGIVTQTTDSTTYAHEGGNLNETTTVSTTAHSYGHFGVVAQHVKNDMALTTGSEKVRLIRCELCDVTCNSEDILENHKKGKKHLKNLQKQAISSAIGPKMPPSAEGDTVVGELENKKHKLLQNGASINSLIFCEICNVACNNQDVFKKHLAGKKHAAKEAKLSNPKSGTAPVHPSDDGTQEHHVKEAKPTAVESTWCELCGIGCNSPDMLKTHISGKKHQKNLEKSRNPIGPDPAPTAEPPTAPELQDSAEEEGKVINLGRRQRPAASEEDLETKRRKILEGGAAASSLRTCGVCNVVCNSPTVFVTHLAGQKHAQMAVKQAAEARSNGEQA